MSEDKSIVLFTGQSGIQIKTCLKRIQEKLEDTYEIISVEETMAEIEDRDFRKEILKEKLSYQYDLWNKAFTNILDKIKTNGDKECFINLHGIYYHQDKREYVSVIDFKLIQKLHERVKFLVVFIDDIHDIYQRLLKENEIFHKILNKKPLDALHESIFNLKNLLEWRQMEIAISRIISKFLDIKMFIIATKHPIFTITRMIENPIQDLEFYYLSHPITEIRRKSPIIYDPYPGELNIFIQNVKNYTKKVFFFPTTIDEYRIEKRGNIYIPEFLPRWPLHFHRSELINGSFSVELNNPNPLNPKNLDIYSDSEGIKMSVSSLLNLLLQSIYNQITSRDLSLVEQSINGLILYRPDYPPEYSGGVIRELKYNLELYKKDQITREVYRLSLNNECTRIRIYHFFNLVKIHMKEDKDELLMKNFFNKIEDWINEYNWLEVFKNQEALESNLNSIKELIRNNLGEYSFDDSLFKISYSLKGLDLAEEAKNLESGFKAIIKTIFDDILEEFIINKGNIKKFEQTSEISLSEIFNS